MNKVQKRTIIFKAQYMIYELSSPTYSGSSL